MVTLGRLRATLADTTAAASVAWRSGLASALRPGPSVQGVIALVRDGISPAAGYSYGAARYPDAVALVDDYGALTFPEVAERASRLAAGFQKLGFTPPDRVGLLCRNHRHFVVTLAALSGLGIDVVLLNTSFAASELAWTLESTRAAALVHDEEFDDVAGAAAGDLTRFVVAMTPNSSISGLGELDSHRPRVRLAPRKASRYILLTSGTTGRPKAHGRQTPLTPDPFSALLEQIPRQVRDVTLIASPLFHAWGFSNLSFSIVLSSTVVLSARFDPRETLAAIGRHRARTLIAVPTMLERILELPEEQRRRYDTSTLEIVATSGSALPGDLATRFMNAYGDILYNLYGSTEAAWAAIATPRDLRADPGTAGRPPRGTELRILDENGAEVPAGSTGRIFVRNSLTVGGKGASIGALIPTGDVGHLNQGRLLFVEGREDDMVVSGGENVYPQEVENVLALHPGVAEVAVLAEPDPQLGQRLRALVVPRGGSELSEDELRRFVGARLARFKVPRRFTLTDSLPRTETGKVPHKSR